MATDAEKARWYDEIAPRLTNFANDLPPNVVKRGVDVMNFLRDMKAMNAGHTRPLIGPHTADDLSCFLMCVDQFWEQRRNEDIANRTTAFKDARIKELEEGLRELLPRETLRLFGIDP